MQTNTTEQQYFGGEFQLTTPHFDEEATVLSARPVVPLESLRETRTEAHSTRHLVFVLSILAALVVGALGATVIYKQRGQEAAALNVNAATPESGAGALGSTVAATATGEAGGDVAQEREWSANGPGEDKRPEPQTARLVAQPVVTRRVSSVKAVKKPAEPEYQMDEKEMRHAERIEARRLRRRAERDEENVVRGQRRRRADDLLRIREIFEGPGRP